MVATQTWTAEEIRTGVQKVIVDAPGEGFFIQPTTFDIRYNGLSSIPYANVDETAQINTGYAGEVYNNAYNVNLPLTTNYFSCKTERDIGGVIEQTIDGVITLSSVNVPYVGRPSPDITGGEGSVTVTMVYLILPR